MRVLVAGASGAIGMPLVRLLRHDGHEVIAVHRTPEGRARLAEAGAIPVRALIAPKRCADLTGSRDDTTRPPLQAGRAGSQRDCRMLTDRGDER